MTVQNGEPSASSSGAEDIDALEGFVTDNQDLERLESILGPFNVFEAIGATWHELRHSDFLAYLLDPSQPHALDDTFAKRLLKAALLSLPRAERPVSIVELDVWDLSDLEVRREWENIDILLLSRKTGLAVIIENKLLTGEHDEQLGRYWREVEQRQLANRLVGVYLTRSGEPPSDNRYLPLTYAAVCQAVEEVLNSQGSRLGGDFRVVLEHYGQLLRRHVLEQSEVAILARAIYRKHRRAIDLIIEHRPDRQLQLRGMIDELLSQVTDVAQDASSKSLIRFCPRAWDQSVPSAETKEWLPSQRLLAFELGNSPDRLSLKLIIGPGPVEPRQSLLNHALANRNIYKPSQKVLGKSWNTIWQRDLLLQADLVEEMDEVERRLRERWNQFVTVDLPRLTNDIVALNLVG